MIIALNVSKFVIKQILAPNGHQQHAADSSLNSMAILEKIINADENKGRDCVYSAEGASIHVNLSGKRTLVGRGSGECFV